MARKSLISNDNPDHKYFTITQRLVWALSRSPYDFTLWATIKDIAGESEECIISTPDLAILAMMSAGKVSECREYLINVGLLVGIIRKDPGYPQPVWHLRIPDIWEQNIKWSLTYPKISERIEFKKQQKAELSLDESLKEVSPGERGIPPGERGIPPGERGIPPGETKKKRKELKEKPKEKTMSLFFGGINGGGVKNPQAAEALRKAAQRETAGVVYWDKYPEDVQTVLTDFSEIFQFPAEAIPAGKTGVADWIKDLRAVQRACNGTGVRAVMTEIREMAKKGEWTVARPGSLLKSVPLAIKTIKAAEQPQPPSPNGAWTAEELKAKMEEAQNGR